MSIELNWMKLRINCVFNWNSYLEWLELTAARRGRCRERIRFRVVLESKSVKWGFDPSEREPTCRVDCFFGRRTRHVRFRATSFQRHLGSNWHGTTPRGRIQPFHDQSDRLSVCSSFFFLFFFFSSVFSFPFFFVFWFFFWVFFFSFVFFWEGENDMKWIGDAMKKDSNVY